MFTPMARIRLHIDHPLNPSERVPLSREQAHYLFGVMRLDVGAEVLLFNGQDGEWRAQVIAATKKGGVLECAEQTKPLQMPPDVWLVFAPIKKDRTSFIVEKAAELGAAKIIPMQTEYTQSANRIRQDKLQAHALEAAEQCGGTYVPEVAELQKFAKLLDGWDDTRRILFCDEAMVGQALDLPKDAGPWAIFIGPEGGFSDKERDRLRGMAHAHAISLGPRILRADTAAVAALTLWQQTLGDWI
ncbi:16S rRNA (uracil1498-N3)-methyltransferase [Octadecabacter temperatus]|uniref:Ribosomal RNA small subunit methyltransferase E n=1 Tax=Octadecabacter temperatus TaxID=1458307 RepID=A0A0K0Y978_9RHOB|nr:16S rRNA (uracil(1498)-N(3))-methyltransferase [Octadecabacter temperatus]AKS47422.1 Ribosomal RNA small subunit methyltransferase E [Octadecabacter temperatus]SIO42861.1 16S rRNA (uracil1498-N3)-methyltransferase [Octadecabacter temperatus]